MPRCFANITGRSQHDEARSPTYDLVQVGAVITTRAKWLGHILRMDANSYLHRVARELYYSNYEGSIICAMSLSVTSALAATQREHAPGEGATVFSLVEFCPARGKDSTVAQADRWKQAGALYCS